MAGSPTKRAPDVWDSAAFSSIFLASSFFCSQTESTPAHTQVTQTVGWQRQRAKPNTSLIRKVGFMFGSKIQNCLLAVAFYLRLVSASKFSIYYFLLNKFSFINKISGWFCQVAKIDFKVFGLRFG
jgi:hypothetical protein